MRRLLLLPATAAAGAVVWFSPFAWPILTTIWSVIAPRQATEHTEADVFG